MWHDIWPSMVTNTRNLCSAFNPSTVHTHSSEYTHGAVNTHTHSEHSEHTHTLTVNTHTHTHTHTHGAVGSHLCCGARGAVGGSVPCSRVEGGESAVHSLPPPPPTIPAGPRLEPTTFELRVLLSNIRPRLPPDLRRVPVSLSLSDGFTWFYLIVFFQSTLKLHLINLKWEFFCFYLTDVSFEEFNILAHT